MAHRVMRRRCPQCHQVKPFQRPEQETCSYRCASERRRLAVKPELAGFGVLTERERAIYQRGWDNGIRTGHKRWFTAGRRRGFAEALREAPEISWRKGRAA